jgi:DNA-directed RNA polymerase specialized sigma24 family protein
MNDDLDAIRRVLAADVESFRRLVERYQRPLLTLIRNLTPSDTDHEGVAQEVFLAAFRSLASFDPNRSAFSTWLFTIARNRCRNELARRRPVVGAELPDVVDLRSPERAGLGGGRRRCRTGCVSCWATTGTIRATAARSASWPLATCSATYSTGTGQPRRGPGSAS